MLNSTVGFPPSTSWLTVYLAAREERVHCGFGAQLLTSAKCFLVSLLAMLHVSPPPNSEVGIAFIIVKQGEKIPCEGPALNYLVLDLPGTRGERIQTHWHL